MQIQTIAKSLLLTTVVLAATAGCNVGNAPSGGSTAEVEANFKKLDPQEQIKIIQTSPAPAEKKAQLIKDIEDKYGIKAGAAPVQPGTSNPTPPPADPGK